MRILCVDKKENNKNRGKFIVKKKCKRILLTDFETSKDFLSDFNTSNKFLIFGY